MQSEAPPSGANSISPGDTSAPVARLGGRGSEPGRFQRPAGISFDAFGHLFVADRGNHRILEFDAGLVLVGERGGFGFEPGRFVDPRAVVADRGTRVYVLDTSGGRVQTLDARREPEGVLLDARGAAGGLGIHRPVAMAVDGAGRLFLSDRETQSLLVYSASGDSLAAWGGFGDGPGQFRRIAGACVDARGSVWVADEARRRVVRLDAAGGYVSEFEAAPESLAASRPFGVAVAADGRVAVADPGLRRVTVFSASGQAQAVLEGDGTHPFEEPVAVAWGGDRLAVADQGAHVVLVFRMPGVPARPAGAR
ncbi:MAG: NHL repeat-containing protein [Candidatus Eisenbacteria bacterium]|nr:NHL repeat-containing protein [Candidatus Eisenbacteria bacterium]